MKYYQDEELMLKISQKMGGCLTCQAVNPQAICGLIWSTCYGSFNHPMDNHDTSCFPCFHLLLAFPHQSCFNIFDPKMGMGITLSRQETPNSVEKVREQHRRFYVVDDDLDDDDDDDDDDEEEEEED